MKTHLSVDNSILSVVRDLIVWLRCPLRRLRNNVNFTVRSFRLSCEARGCPRKWVNTRLTPQIDLYRGRAGRSSKIPFMKHLATGNCPNGMDKLEFNCKMDDNMLLAVFMVLYEEPLSYSMDKKSTVMGIGGDKMLQRCCLQNASHFSWYWEVVPSRHDEVITSIDMVVKPRPWSCCLTVDR